MDTHTCAQRGCEFEVDEADELPENCPVCNNPLINGGEDTDPAWEDLTKDELKAQCDEWELEYSSRANKDELIEILEDAEAKMETGELDDDDDDGNGDD